MTFYDPESLLIHRESTGIVDFQPNAYMLCACAQLMKHIKQYKPLLLTLRNVWLSMNSSVMLNISLSETHWCPMFHFGMLSNSKHLVHWTNWFRVHTLFHKKIISFNLFINFMMIWCVCVCMCTFLLSFSSLNSHPKSKLKWKKKTMMKNVNDQYTECSKLIWNLSLFSIKFVCCCCCCFFLLHFLLAQRILTHTVARA